MCTSLAACSQEFPTDGHELYLHCEGKPSTFTVILIAGGGGTTDTWNKVQSPISKFAQVCSYDRLGLGKSDPLPSGSQQSIAEIVADLAGLLKEARLQPPYLLVGHSVGGLYARAFDERFDNEVAGMILLDSSHEEQIWRFAKSEPDALKEYPRWQDQQYMLSQGYLLPGEHLKWRFTKPLIVIEHGIPPEPVWHEMQLDLASRSSQSQFVVATQSSHYIQKLQPQLVIDAVHTLEESKGGFGVFRKLERGGSASDH